MIQISISIYQWRYRWEILCYMKYLSDRAQCAARAYNCMCIYIYIYTGIYVYMKSTWSTNHIISIYLNFRIVQCSMYILVYYIYIYIQYFYFCIPMRRISSYPWLGSVLTSLGTRRKQSMHSEWHSLLPQTIQNWNPVSGPKAISRGPRPQHVEAANRMLGKHQVQDRV